MLEMTLRLASRRAVRSGANVRGLGFVHRFRLSDFLEPGVDGTLGKGERILAVLTTDPNPYPKESQSKNSRLKASGSELSWLVRCLPVATHGASLNAVRRSGARFGYTTTVPRRLPVATSLKPFCDRTRLPNLEIEGTKSCGL